jgi:hypothetical protein
VRARDGLLLEEGDEAGDIVFRGSSWVDVHLEHKFDELVVEIKAPR